MSTYNANRKRLIEIVKARSFSTGAEIKLVSGRSSNFYFNMKPTMLDAEGASVVRVISIVDRLEGAADNFKAAGIPFSAVLTVDDFR